MNTKTEQVKEHLLNNGYITSWEAIQLYNATRLSAIIFELRKRGYLIENEWMEHTDKYGRKSRFVKYNLIKEEDYIKKNINHIPIID